MLTSRDEVVDLSGEVVRGLLKSAYGLEAEDLSVVSGEIATVCRVRVGKRMLAVKALPGSEYDGRLMRWQTDAMVTLRRHGLPVPSVMATREGALVHESCVDSLAVFTVVTDWLRDPPLSQISELDDALLEAIGTLAGRVSIALADVSGPPVPARHEWELVRAAESIRSVLPRVSDPEIAALTAEVATIHDESIAPVIPRLPRSVLHHDLHDDNLLIGTLPDNTRGITGILDFGDMVVGPRIAECVVAAAYASRNSAEPAHAIERVAAGWHRVRPLIPEERRILLPGVLARLALNSAVWAARASGPRAAYASSRSAGTLETLQQLLEVEPAAFMARLGDACPA